MTGPHPADRAFEILKACRDRWIRRADLVEAFDCDPDTVAQWCERWVRAGLLIGRRAEGSTRAREYTLAKKWGGVA
jgi:hypothetical protein